jgi:hypothetical protein
MSSAGPDHEVWSGRSPYGRDVLAAGVRLRLPLPGAAREEPPEELPAVDLSAIAGARVALRRGLQGEAGLTLRALCATAPSDRWAPGVEELVLDRASALARSAVPGAIERWEPGPAPAWTGQQFEQRFEGAARAADGSLAIRGRHLLGFADEERAALLCTVLCVEPAPAPPGAETDRCRPLVEAVTLEGALSPPPPPSLLARGLLLAAEHPGPAAVLLAVIGAAGIAFLLARRPRRPSRTCPGS